MQIDNSMEQDFLYHKEEIIYPGAANVVYEHEESQQHSEEINWYANIYHKRDCKIQTVEQ